MWPSRWSSDSKSVSIRAIHSGRRGASAASTMVKGPRAASASKSASRVLSEIIGQRPGAARSSRCVTAKRICRLVGMKARQRGAYRIGGFTKLDRNHSTTAVFDKICSEF